MGKEFEQFLGSYIELLKEIKPLLNKAMTNAVWVGAKLRQRESPENPAGHGDGEKRRK